ncbi:carboxylating nicotinate-nucleotide diphosphorylase [Alkalitalea saponilacus]|uniref:Probable nicotinate-nucleotide pyrophosphorylase [carboxylating] n=1 Tax=Alkalitalea saponilacus TaxID=889453 RepID=A0A1T5HTK6_9BACT|nr:carboxylating nicotinate-nucleotide diphosphorylase [Alkalitalea saponilacus]ASB48506.1 nicotinate-nucleotide diphosphorylase (carboxylating) [Alkalitalea saponilacus]SKC23871.1 nicotinate-nucleotide pyrophosphorylase [carboxylating] [Alkalitalea saponilacus]
MTNDWLTNFIKSALQEDIGDGDHSSLACIPQNARGKAVLLAKETGIIAGVEIAVFIFKHVEPTSKVNVLIQDGTVVYQGDKVFEVEASVHTLLKAERLVLNIMQRLSGVATKTNQYVRRLEGLQTKVLDTRKTTPGMRLLEKQAVLIGGGTNHRIGLYDMIMLKDNHIDFAGGIENAITRTKSYLKDQNKDLRIEVEVRNFEELNEVLRVGGIDRIMLDNFTVEDTKEAVAIINGAFEIESSGNITLETIRDYAETGVDFVSVGALTHQISSLDLSLKAT